MPIPTAVNPRCNVDKNKERQKPLWACIDRASRELGLSHATVALSMTYFLEELASQVTKGRVVRIDGFGIFGPRWHIPTERMRPNFSYSRGFREQVRWGCNESFDQKKTLRIHSKNRSNNARRTNMRVFSSMESTRKEIRKQLMIDEHDD
jgi:hypothetical protein